MEDELNRKGLMRAVQKLTGWAATAVKDDELRKQLKQLQAQQSFWYWQNTTTGSTTANMPQAYQNVTLGGGLGYYSGSTNTETQKSPSISFTDEQMSLFMDKLTHLLTKGWECLRCHRIWNPRETGCEFCNFIDRLEGKDVERDTAA